MTLDSVGAFVVFDKCPRCSAPRLVPTYAPGRGAPKVRSTCQCSGASTDQDDERVERAQVFDRAVVDAHVVYSAKKEDPVHLTENVLLLGKKLGDMQQALVNGHPGMVLEHLVKLTALARQTAVESEDLQEYFKLLEDRDTEPGDPEGEDDDDEDE